MDTPEIHFVVALSKQTRAIGKEGKLLWYIPKDMKHFKDVTLGHPMIMGRGTFDSIGRVLPGRVNIVITRNPDWKHEGVVVCHSLEEALETAKTFDTEKMSIIGGAQIFQLALPYATHLHLTEVDDEKEGDVYFPEINEVHFEELEKKDGEHDGIKYSIRTLKRK